MIEDVELLRRYAKDGCAKSFELIVRRHIGWVYSAALRMVHDAALAEDLAQSVFVLLENRAGSLKEGVALSGWLFNTLRFVAKESRRKDQRRRKHEARAALPEGAKAPNGVDDAVWEQMSPLLEEAVATLAEADRQAVLLRFYEGAEFAHIGKTLGITEVTARKRVSRAVKKLGAFFKKKGVIVPAVLLASALFARTAQAAPAALVDSIISAASGNTGAALAGSLVRQTALRFMIGRRKLAAAIVACMGLFGVALWTLLLAWLVRAPDEGEGARTPFTGPVPGQWHEPPQFANDEIDLGQPSVKGYGNFTLGEPKTRPQAKEPVTSIDALWWFREMYDLRNSPNTAQARAKKNENDDDPMIEDPSTGIMHPRSWFEENGVPYPNSIVQGAAANNGSGGGGGGRAGDGRMATASSDATTGKSGSGAEHGGGIGLGSGSEVITASSSSGGDTSAEAGVLVALSKPGTYTSGITPPSRLELAFNPAQRGGDEAVWNVITVSGTIYTFMQDGYVIIQSGKGKDMHLTLIHRNSNQTGFSVRLDAIGGGTLVDSTSGHDYADMITVGATGELVLPAGDVPQGFDPNDPAVLAEIAAIRAKYGNLSPDQISLGYVGEHGQVVSAQVPEPGVGLVVAMVVLMLGRRSRSQGR